MKKRMIVGVIIILVILAGVYSKSNFIDKKTKISNINSLEHSGAGDIE